MLNALIPRMNRFAGRAVFSQIMKRLIVLIIAVLAPKIATAQEPQSNYVPPEFIAGRGYVGLYLTGADQDFRKIAAVFPNSPAAKAGIIAGDFILAIDQFFTDQMSLQEFSRHSAARPGTNMQLTLKRAQSGATETLQLQRVAPFSLGFVCGAPEKDFRMITAVLPNSPAANSGIVAGDYILAINEQDTEKMSFEEFVCHAWAPVGADTQFTLKRLKTGVIETIELQQVDHAMLNPKVDDLAAYVPSLAQR